MGTAITNFQSVVGAQSAGTADIEKMVAAFQGLEGAIDRAGKKGDELNQHKGFGEFAEKVKQGIENPLQAIGGAAESVLKALGPVGTGVVAVAGILGIAGKVSFEAARSLGLFGDQLSDMAVRMGVSVKEASEFTFAMKYAGGDVGSLQGIMRKLSDEVEGGGKHLAAIGVEYRDLRTGALKPTAEIVVELSERLKAMPNTFERNAAAVKIMGRSALDVLPDLMELAEGTKRAQELGFSWGDADTQRWAEYHHRVAEAEQAYERLAMKVKEPLAAVITFLISDGKGHQYSLDDLKKRGVNVAGFEPLTPFQEDQAAAASGLDNSHIQGWRRQSILSGAMAATDAIELRRAADAAVAAYESRRGADLDYQLQKAEERLKDLKEPTKGVSSLADVAAYDAAQRQVASIRARIEANKELEQQQKHLDGEVTAFHVRALETELSAGEKIIRQRDELIAQALQLGRSEAYVGTIRADASKALDQLLQKSFVDFEKWDRGASPAAQSRADKWKVMFGANGALNPLAGLEESLKAYDAATKADSRIEDIELSSRRGEITARAGRADRMQQLMLGPGHEAEAAEAGYRIRLGLAQQLYTLDVERALKEEDGDQRRIDMAKALADLGKERYEAEIERELKIAELQRQRIDQWRSFAVGALHGLESGDVSGFLKQQTSGLLDRVVGNAAEMSWKSVSGMIPHASEGSFLGKLLAGSQFGPDPMKVAGVRLETAGDRLTMAAVDLTGAARALASSPSGGGGGFVRAAMSAVPGGPGAAPEGGMSDWLGWLDKNGENGDYAGETPHPAGAFNWGKTAGIVGAGVGGFYGLYSGIQAGGARGALTAAGSTIAAAGSIVALASKSLASIAGPIGLIAGLGLGTFLPTLMPDRRKQRAEEIDSELAGAHYRAPESSTYTVDRYGRNFDYDSGGGLRPIINLHFDLLDARSVEDRMPMIMDKVTEAMESRQYPRYETQIRRLADRG